MVSAFSPDPGDLPVKNQFLKAANGSRMACYGYKDILIKIGRKPYPFKIIKAQVESPIIGWDFMKHHKLDLRGMIVTKSPFKTKHQKFLQSYI